MIELETKDNCILVAHRPPFKVTLEYFKNTGKYYSDGEYYTDKLNMFEIFEEVGGMLTSGKLPGLVAGAREFYVVVRAPDHPFDYPALIIPHA